MSSEKAQSTMEVVVLIGFAAVAFLAMISYIIRAYQGGIRDKAEQLSEWQYAPGSTIDIREYKRTTSKSDQTTETDISYGNLNEVNTELVKKLKEIEDKQKELEDLNDLWEITARDEGLKWAAEVREDIENMENTPTGLKKVSDDRTKAYEDLKKLNKEADDIQKAWPPRKKNTTGETRSRSSDEGDTYYEKKDPYYEEVGGYR